MLIDPVMVMVLEISPCKASSAVAPGSVNVPFNSTSTSAYPVMVTTGGVLSAEQVPQLG